MPRSTSAASALREDLLYRLNGLPLDLPPLRRRLEDVPLLARHLLAAAGEKEGPARRFTPAAFARSGRYRRPGNVRELRNAVPRADVMAQGDEIDATWLPGAEGAAPTAQRDRSAPSLRTARSVGSGSGSGRGRGSEDVGRLQNIHWKHQIRPKIPLRLMEPY